MGAEIAVIAADAVGFGGVYTEPCVRVTASIKFACSRSRAGDFRACTYPRLAGVVDGTGVGVVARATVRFCRIRADPGLRVTKPYVMALAQGFAGNWATSEARPIRAGLTYVTEVTVVTEGAVRFGWVIT